MATPALLQAGLGLAGSFIRGKTPQYIKDMQAAIAEQRARQNQYWQLVQNYNPAVEDAKAMDYARKTQGQALSGALERVSADFARNGGVPGGDTGILYNLQRSQDSYLNPLGAMAAERAATQYQRKMSAMESALGTANPTQLIPSYLQAAYNPAPSPSALTMLSQGINALMPSQQTKTPGVLSGNPAPTRLDSASLDSLGAPKGTRRKFTKAGTPYDEVNY